MTQSILRWAIGSPHDPRSSIWRLWGNPKGDVYAAVRSLGGMIKASFHRDGKCQVGFTSEYAVTALSRFGRRRRHWETWKLPTEPMVRVLQILVPQSELRRFTRNEGAGVVWVPAPALDSIAVVSAIVAPPLAEVTPEMSSNACLIGTVRTNLRNAWVFYNHCSPDATLRKIIAVEKAKLRRLTERVTVPPGTRAIIWDSRPDHDRHVIELACDH
jgi:hypothetical protein